MKAQSPVANITTTPEKKLTKGVGFETIYYSQHREKIEVTTNRTVLRKTVWKNDGRHEVLYQRESDPIQIRKIEDLSPNWRVRGANSPYKYYVEFQLDSNNKAIGNIRIVSHKNAKHVITGPLSAQLVVDDKENYTYYVRRKK